MANPRLNLPLVGDTVNDRQFGHLIRTLRDWARHVDTAIDETGISEADADVRYVNHDEFNTLGDARYYTETEIDATVTVLTAADTVLDGRLDTAETDITALEAIDGSLDSRLDTVEAALTSGPYGIVGYAQTTADTGSITSPTIVDITSLSVTFTAISGRSYKMTGQTTASTTVANDTVWLYLRTGTTVLQTCKLQLASASNTQTLAFTYVTSAVSGSTTWKLSMVRAAGSGTITAANDATTPGFILVEDIGVL